MKYIKKYSSYNEAKNVGLLYHYTSEKGIQGILDSNRMKCSWEYYMYEHVYYLSFTRNKNLHLKGEMFNINTDYRITLDGTLLSNHYKIKPFGYLGGWDNEWEDGHDWEEFPEKAIDFERRHTTTGVYDEMEERILFKDQTGGIDNIKKYIIAIDKLK
jgi:hypothetical protein